MTPGARIAAAADLLDGWRAGEPVERLLTTWARQNRYAGSRIVPRCATTFSTRCAGGVRPWRSGAQRLAAVS